MNVDRKGCRLDHHHCHNCGEERHRAFECPNVVVPSDFNNNNSDNNSSVVFRMISSTNGNRIVSVPYRGNSDNYYQSSSSGALQDRPLAIPPALIVLGGRLRGRTLATCEMLPLSSPSSYSNTSVSSQKSSEDGQKHRCWYPLPPNLLNTEVASGHSLFDLAKGHRSWFSLRGGNDTFRELAGSICD